MGDSDITKYNQRDKSGEYVPKYPPEHFIEALEESDDELTTSEISEQIGCGYRTAYDRLNKLEDKDRVDSRMRGSVKVWSLSEDESAYARDLSKQSIANQYGDDYFGETAGWADDLPDLGENA